MQSRGAGGSGEDSPSHLACYPPVREGAGDRRPSVCCPPSSLLFLFGITDPPCTQPCWGGDPREPPGAKLYTAERWPSWGGGSLPFAGVSRGVILSEAAYQQRLWPAWGLGTPSSHKGSQLPPPPIPGHLGILTAFASSGFQELWLPCHALRALGPGSPEAAPLGSGVFAGGPLGFVATQISAFVFRVGENV